MTSLSRAGIVGVIVAVAAAVIYLAVFSGGSGGPAGGGASGQARAEKLFSGLMNLERFSASGGSVRWESAEPLDGGGVLIRKLRIEGTDWDGRPTTLSADEMRVRRIDWDNVGMSPYGDVEIRGLTAVNSRIAAFTAATGATDFVADLKARWDWKPDTRVAEIQAFDLTVRELGTLSLHARFHDVDLAALQEMQPGGDVDPAFALGLMAGAKIGGFEIAFADRGAIDKLAAKRAEQTGLSKKQVIDRVVAGLAAQRAHQPLDIVRRAFDALIVFVEKRGTIALKAAPKRPVPLLRLALTGRSSLAGIDRLARELGLTVEAR
ncbi:MAG: hypothetical protein OXF89_11555 [Rhodospirillaceae bacterium]|nr:hypothetical protein [Rhodospirillaceae bacterium]MCY4065441.1 hypothetical protein [Rhodospirillaceae bacterium]